MRIAIRFDLSSYIALNSWIETENLLLSSSAKFALNQFARHCATSIHPEEYELKQLLGDHGDIVEQYKLNSKRIILYRRSYLREIDSFLSNIDGWETASALEMLGRILTKSPMKNGVLEQSLEHYIREKTPYPHNWEYRLGEVYLLLEKFPSLRTTHVPLMFDRDPESNRLADYLPNWALEFLFKLSKFSAERLEESARSHASAGSQPHKNHQKSIR